MILQFVHGGDLGAKAIEWFSHGACFSHVDTVWPDGRLFGARSDIIGGAAPGVQFRAPQYVGNSVTLQVSLNVERALDDAYYTFMLAQEGKPYDMEGILAFVSGRNWRQPDSWFCSELVAAGLEQCEYFRTPLATPSNKMTPPDLLLALSARLPITLP
jgi:hypothetical protein